MYNNAKLPINKNAGSNVYSPIINDYSFIKKLIWVYFILLLTEGAFRKWFLPNLSQAFLIIRDPIVIWIYFLAFQENISINQNKYINFLWKLTLVACFTSFIINQTHPIIIFYGIHTNYLHMPLIFVMSRTLDKKDVINFGKAFLLSGFFMTFLVAEQFQAEKEGVLNIGAGGTGYQLETSGGKLRASGTFSFVTGIVYFYAFAIAFVIYGFISKNKLPMWMVYIGAGSALLAMVTAGSRSVIAECLQVVACFVFLAYYKPSEFGKISASVFGLAVTTFFLYSQIDLFQEGIEFLGMRFEEAANVEGNPIEAYFFRYFDILKAPYMLTWVDLFGQEGIGSATRAGSALATRLGIATSIGFVETAWSQPIIENGMIIGCTFLLWRIWITKDLLLETIKSIKRGNYLPIFLFGASGPILLTGLYGQPTTLGFAAFGTGLCLASTKE